MATPSPHNVSIPVIEDYLVLCQTAAGLQASSSGGVEKELPVSWRGWKTTSSSSAQNIVTLCYGMNDGGYSTVKSKTLDTYRSTITDIVKR